MRLDNILFRAGFAKTIPEARQLINHGHILVNNRKVNIPSYTCGNKDQITTKTIDFIKNNSENQQAKKIIPSHLSVNFQELKINVLSNFNYEETGLKINELLVVEYYSRS